MRLDTRLLHRLVDSINPCRGLRVIAFNLRKTIAKFLQLLFVPAKAIINVAARRLFCIQTVARKATTEIK